MSGEIQENPKTPSERDIRLYVEHVINGHPLRRLGKKFGLSFQRVAAICQSAQPWVLRQLVAEHPDRLTAKLKEHAIHERLYQLAMDGWRRSRKNKEQTTVSAETSDEKGNKTSRRQQFEGQAGDVRFLQEAREARKAIRELWGLDETDKIDVNLNQRETHIVVIEDPNWYGNRAHELDAARANATPAIGPALGGEVQGGSLRPTLGQNGAGPNGAH